MPEITEDDMQAAVNKLKKGKACDNNGIRAENIKNCNDTTKEKIRQIFNQVINKKAAHQEHGEECA